MMEMEYLKKKNTEYTKENKKLRTMLKEITQRNDKLQRSLNNAYLQISHEAKMVQKGTEMFQIA